MQEQHLHILCGPPTSGSVTSGSVDNIQVNTINVGGTGTVSMSPDEAFVYLGVQTVK
ncbi:MAG: hypothetical protein M8353_01245 [ANME-2 cluster archaeon]|nr:hypothetical protein [ANME-2 cluster archaeon]